MLLYLVGIVVLSYFIAKTLVIKLENENESLKKELVYVRVKHKEEIEQYKQRLYLMNNAFDQFKKGK